MEIEPCFHLPRAFSAVIVIIRIAYVSIEITHCRIAFLNRQNVYAMPAEAYPQQ